MERVQSTGAGALTAQILAEFFTSSARKLCAPLTLEDASSQIELLARVWPVFEVTAFTILETMRSARTYHMSYWDAQIWASARLNQVPMILSEDLNTGAVIEGVRFVNPFAESFDLDAWLPE